jgi:hypothetical protein
VTWEGHNRVEGRALSRSEVVRFVGRMYDSAPSDSGKATSIPLT